MATRFFYTIAIAGVVTAAPACNEIVDAVDDGRLLGTISHYQDPIVIATPDTVQRGQHFDVRVRTYGGGCISKGSTDVSITDLGATVTPYDIDSGSSSGSSLCTADLRFLEHAATLYFDRSGVATITIRGMRRPEGSTITEQRVVVVR